MSETTCPECAVAARGALSPIYRGGCLECEARHLAHMPAYWTSRAARRMMPAYVDALRAVFGADVEAGHMRVKRWGDRIDAARLAKEA